VKAARVAALAAVVVTAVVVVYLVTRGDPYRVDAVFDNASQLVKGNRVTVAGEAVGEVKDIKLTDDGQALIKMTIDDAYAPLRRGTRAIIRQTSLSGQANRYVSLQLGGADRPKIPDGGTIDSSDAISAVDLDQLFNVFDPDARTGVRRTIRGFRDSTRGSEDDASRALMYVSPALSASSRLFGELNRSTPSFERFIVEGSQLVTDTASRSEELTSLVGNLSTTMDAVASRRSELGQAVETLPTFLRRANTTFVNLRGALDDLDPLVADAKPVVRNELRPLFAELRPFAAAAEPTIRDLSKTIRRPGAGNDLVELLRAQPAVDRIANQTAERNGAQRPGTFPASRDAFRGASPQVGFLRPYTVDLVGWFDDFSTSGAYDALGSFSRAGLQLNGFTFGPGSELLPVPPELRGAVLSASLATGRNNRCPGSVERSVDGSNPYRPSPDFNCDPSQVPVGP